MVKWIVRYKLPQIIFTVCTAYWNVFRENILYICVINISRVLWRVFIFNTLCIPVYSDVAITIVLLGTQ